jgi:hypothetical protein
LLASERVKLRRWRQPTSEPAPLNLEVLGRVVPRLVPAFVFPISFALALVRVAVVVLIPAVGAAAPSLLGQCNLPLA